MDAEMSPRDLALYKALGEVGTRLTGYPVISTYEDFTPDKTKVRHGSLKDWVYEEMGIICFSTELWDLEIAAGVEKKGYYNLRPAMRTCSASCSTGCWPMSATTGSATGKPSTTRSLARSRSAGWSISGATATRPAICWKRSATTTRCSTCATPPPHRACGRQRHGDRPLGADLHKVTAMVANHGYLPTNLSDVAIKNKVAKPVTVTLDRGG
jgi:hypothetical protein